MTAPTVERLNVHRDSNLAASSPELPTYLLEILSRASVGSRRLSLGAHFPPALFSIDGFVSTVVTRVNQTVSSTTGVLLVRLDRSRNVYLGSAVEMLRSAYDFPV